MPTEWKYHADGVDTAVSTTHDLDGTLSEVRIQLDGFRTREWSEEEAAESDRDLFEDEDGVHVEYADGKHATFRYTVDDGVATLRSIEPKDDDQVRPDHLALLKPVERILARLDGIDEFHMGIQTLREEYSKADQAGTHIDALDS